MSYKEVQQASRLARKKARYLHVSIDGKKRSTLNMGIKKFKNTHGVNPKQKWDFKKYVWKEDLYE